MSVSLDPDFPGVRRVPAAERAEGIGRVVLEAASLDSTNRRLAELGRVGTGHGVVLVTREQTAGTGKGARSWFSRGDGSLCMSVLIRTGRGLAEAAQLTLLAAVAMREAIATVAGVEAAIKWPNDILVDRRKVCGILAEAGTDDDGELDFVVVGLGLNLDLAPEEFPVELRSAAISLSTLAGRRISRDATITAFAENFDRRFRLWEERGLSAFAAEWTAHALDLGRVVRLSDGDEDLCATLIGLADDGALRIRDAGGTVRDVHSGEIATEPAVGRASAHHPETHMGTCS